MKEKGKTGRIGRDICRTAKGRHVERGCCTAFIAGSNFAHAALLLR